MAKKVKKKPGKGAVGELSFEQALERLEGLIERVESGEVGLEESLAQYEQGTALVKRCRSILETAEKRIAELTVDAEGKLRAGGESAKGRNASNR